MKQEQHFTGTREWACKTVNVCLGCSHDCAYCYAKSMAIRFGRATAESWQHQSPLPRKATHTLRGKPTRVMFPSSHDITPECLDICMEALRHLLDHDHTVLVVSKPHVSCIQEICMRFAPFRERLQFRFTIGSADNTTLKTWEPNAPSYEERLGSLDLALASNYRTSISCEPMLDTRVEDVVTAVNSSVTDTIWIGVMNGVRSRLTINKASPEVQKRGDELMQQCSVEYIRDLHARLKDNPKVRWKDSIKKMLGGTTY